MPENSVPSRFLEEIPHHLLEDIGQPRSSSVTARPYPATDSHFSYEDEDQSANHYAGAANRKPKKAYSYPTYNSVDNIADFFSSRGKKFNISKAPPAAQPTKTRSGFRPGQKVKHPKYGEGTVYQREGEGESAKITVQFPRFGLKKLVEKYAQLEKA
jgi:DNA helicase-2/ATP-dependent DNA helicase PcrA